MRSKDPNLVLMDNRMSGMDWLEAMRRLRQISAGAEGNCGPCEERAEKGRPG